MFKLIILLFIQISRAEFRFSFESYLSGQKYEIADSKLNPANQIFLLPGEDYYLDLRSELKWRLPQSQVLIRPRWVGRSQVTTNQLTREEKQTSKGEVNLTDAFVESTWSELWTTTIGLQVFQWGPAEFMNASNPFFHFNSKQKNLFFKEKGQFLLRSNLSLDKENNIVISFIPVSNNEPEWIEEDKFEPKALIKYERSWSGTYNSFGLVAGSEEKRNLFLGQYFNYSFLEEASVYADVKQSQYKINYEPVFNGASYDLQYLNDVKEQWFLLGVIGVRWESNFDFRSEIIHNSAGFKSEQLKNAIDSASNPVSLNYVQNLKRFLKPGLEVLGQDYWYNSMRISDPFNTKDFNFYIRYLQSLQDQSGQFQAEIEKSFYDSITFFANQTIVFGNKNSEFRLLNDWSTLLGLRYSL